MKKIFAFILLLCMAFTLSGYYLVFHFRLRSLKAEMHLQLRNGQFSKQTANFSFSKAQATQLDWEDEEEFRINGKMYDVIRMSESADSVFIHCIPDHKEEKLLQNFLEQHKNSSDPVSVSILKLLSSPYLILDMYQLPALDALSKEHTMHYECMRPEKHALADLRPPELVVTSS